MTKTHGEYDPNTREGLHRKSVETGDPDRNRAAAMNEKAETGLRRYEEYRNLVPDHNRERIAEAEGKVPAATTESSGSGTIDRLNEGARQVLGDAEVDYAAAELYMEPDDGAIDAAGRAHGDRITRQDDGSHVVESVEPSPADDQADTEASEALRSRPDRPVWM